MASNKDILDAQRFNRRRLVTAFVAGAPGGRELEPRRITPPLIGGIVLTLVIALASWISGMFVGSLPSDWQNNTLIVVKGEGTRYITVDGRLRPVTNLASARLLAESGKFRQTTLKSSVLDGIERGSRVGIEDAPEQLPATGSLTAHGWTACSTSAGQTAVGVGASPKGLSTIQHALVSVDGRTYLVADGVSHELPADNLGSVLLALGLDSEPITEADATWLSLFTPGSMLQSLTVPDAGTPVTGLSSTIKNPVAGMLLSVTDSAGGQRHYIVQADSSLGALSDVSLALYKLGGGAAAPVQDVSVSDLTQVTTTTAAPEDWPSTLDQGAASGTSACAVLGESTSSGTAKTTLASADQIESGGVKVTGGAGALVRSSAGGSLGPVFLITDAGRAWGLGGELSDTLARLGYEESHVAAVPAAWLALFPTGPELSTQAVWEGVSEQ